MALLRVRAPGEHAGHLAVQHPPLFNSVELGNRQLPAHSHTIARITINKQYECGFVNPSNLSQYMIAEAHLAAFKIAHRLIFLVGVVPAPQSKLNSRISMETVIRESYRRSQSCQDDAHAENQVHVRKQVGTLRLQPPESASAPLKSYGWCGRDVMHMRVASARTFPHREWEMGWGNNFRTEVRRQW